MSEREYERKGDIEEERERDIQTDSQREIVERVRVREIDKKEEKV